MLTHNGFVKKVKALLGEPPQDGQVFLCYFDFAEFKLINRYYGIARGDAFLMAVEAYLGQLPEILAFERIFSDQFACVTLTKAPHSEQEIQEAFLSNANRFLSEQQVHYPACNLRMHCGICPLQNGNVLEALDNANLAWREAKKIKRTAAVVFDDTILAEIAKNFEREAEINTALQEGRFDFYLQPKVDLFTGEIVGAEALARRIDINGDMIYPDCFLETMEENGTVVELDRLILRKVCMNLADRMAKGLPVVRTSVNLSRLHIQAPGAVDMLHDIAQAYRIPPSLLEFELTETILLEQFSGAKILGDTLRGYGYSLAIDDFGAGYAGTNLIQELDFDVIKLDKRFLSQQEPLRTKNKAILPDLLHTLRQLKIETLCEGVEQETQCIYLSQMGCRQAQGYFFSQPVPSETFYAVYSRQKGHYKLPEQKSGKSRFYAAADALESPFDSAIHRPGYGICFVDRMQKIQHWNETAERITGYRAAEIMGKSCWEIGLHPMDEEAWAIFKTAHPLVDSDTGLQYYETHTTIQKKDGCKLPITVKIFPTKIGDEMVGTVEVFSARQD